MSKIGLTETQHQKLAKLLDDTYPIGHIIKVDTDHLPPDLGKAIREVEQKIDELRAAVRAAEDILNEKKSPID
jgi:hypothetical protein